MRSLADPVPFCYAGSKRREQKKILDSLGLTITDRVRIAEPFVGTGRISQLIGADGQCLANDNLLEISQIHDLARLSDREFFDTLEVLMNDDISKNEKTYYSLRAERNAIAKLGQHDDAHDMIRRAAVFYYLLNACHGGMVRFNPRGDFNTSYKIFLEQGRSLCGKERISALRDVGTRWKSVYCLPAFDFVERVVLPACKRGEIDLVYCDPPYESSGFVYGGGWTREDLEKLISLAQDVAKTGAVFAISNYETDVVYEGADIHSFNTVRMAYTKATSKKPKNDILAVWGSFRSQTSLDEII